MVAIDGCSVGCARAILEQAKVSLKSFIMVTELGIEKNKDFNLQAEDIRKVKDAVKAARKNGVSVGKDAAAGVESCCG